MKPLNAIKSRYYAIARQLGALPEHIHFATTPHHDGSPHVERNGEDYCYIVTERGHEFERRTTSDPDELLYWLVADLTWRMAVQFELLHRAPGQDFRRLLFQKHLELLAEVNGEWSQRQRTKYDQILLEHPFDDA